jgi:ABC-type glutathione transport system ATPase component
MSDAPLLEVRDLHVVFSGTDGRRTFAVDGVSLAVGRGQTLGIVGESAREKS